MQVVNGSKENVVVDVSDKTGLTTDLSTSSPTFTVENAAGAVIVNAAVATADQMRVICLLNTTTGGPWVEGLHRLYVGFTVGTEIPKILAGEFYLI